MKSVIIDFEASGLMPGSYPIEVAWAGLDDAVRSYLIKPVAAWADEARLWSQASEKIHGLSQARLLREGHEVDLVAEQVIGALGGDAVAVYSDNPAFDSAWMRRLCSAAGRDPDAVAIDDLDTHLLTITDEYTVAGAYAAARGICPPTHRAARDVEYLLTVYRLCVDFTA